jgi:hypothetical protein
MSDVKQKPSASFFERYGETIIIYSSHYVSALIISYLLSSKPELVPIKTLESGMWIYYILYMTLSALILAPLIFYVYRGKTDENGSSKIGKIIQMFFAVHAFCIFLMWYLFIKNSALTIEVFKDNTVSKNDENEDEEIKEKDGKNNVNAEKQELDEDEIEERNLATTKELAAIIIKTMMIPILNTAVTGNFIVLLNIDVYAIVSIST